MVIASYFAGVLQLRVIESDDGTFRVQQRTGIEVAPGERIRPRWETISRCETSQDAYRRFGSIVRIAATSYT